MMFYVALVVLPGLAVYAMTALLRLVASGHRGVRAAVPVPPWVAGLITSAGAAVALFLTVLSS